MSRVGGYIDKLNSKDGIGQFIRYSFVGGVAAIADVSVFYLLAAILGANYIVANTLAFITGLTINYFLSREWVFGQYIHRPGRDFFLFSVIGIIGLFLSNLILYILIDYGVLYMVLSFAGEDFIKFSAKVIAVFVVLFWNYAARKKIVFNAV